MQANNGLYVANGYTGNATTYAFSDGNNLETSATITGTDVTSS